MNKKVLVVDMDTPIVQAAAVLQYNYKYTHLPTGDTHWFKTKKEYTKQFPEASPDEWECEKDALIETLDDGGDIRWRGYHALKTFMDRMHTPSWVGEVIPVVGGDGNFRYEIAKSSPYKGKRQDKPLLFDDMKNYVLSKWNCVQEDGIEADDVVSMYGWESYRRALTAGKDKNKANTVLCHIDKDINQVPGWHCNFMDESLTPYWVSEEDGTRSFYKQLLTGDSTDGIPGLGVEPTEAMRALYGLRRGLKGVGPASADKIIDVAENNDDLLSHIVWCYQECHAKNWKEYLEEQANLLYMLKHREDEWRLDDYYTP